MLDRIADHSRIVNPSPSDAYVQQRRAAAESLLVDDALPFEAFEVFVEFAVFGVPVARNDRHISAADALIAAIQIVQPSFAADVDGNQLDLRLLAALMVGERLESDPTDVGNQYLASLLLSGLLLQPMPQELYLARLIEELVRLAKTSLHTSSQDIRNRRPWPTKSQLAVTGADVATLSKSASDAIDALLEAVAANSSADREELEVLWWVFGGRSARTGERFDSLSDGERALVAPIELCDRMLMPPIPHAINFLGSIVNEDPQLSLEKLVGHLRKETLTELVKNKQGVQSVLDSSPSLLPLTWLATRLLASDSSPGWQPEFEKKTKLRADTPAALGAWARQVFAESISQRLALPLLSTNSET
jgi:GTPase-associated system helical domain